MTKNEQQKTDEMKKDVARMNVTHEENAAVRRNYKDTLFRMIFKEKSSLLSLYNAVNGTDYTNPEELEIVTLENAIYMNMKNDLAFVMDFYLNLYEHQSTFSPNMPLRNLFYISRELQTQVETTQLYRSKLVRIPTPRFLVFYNGTEEQPNQQILRLSDAFIQPMEEPELELVVTMININMGKNPELLEKCKVLKEYMQYVEKVRKYTRQMELKDAVGRTVEECIQDGILKEFLTKYRNEAIAVSIFEYNEELALKYIREDEYQKGQEVGRIEGEKLGCQIKLIEQICKKLKKGKTPEIIAEELEEDISVIEQICKIAEAYAPEYDSNKIYEKLKNAE